MTAAGTIAAAKVFVLGAGVAGLQAIATARRLGAIVRAYDVRQAVKEQVESVGATFVGLNLEAGTAEDNGGFAKAEDEEFFFRPAGLLPQGFPGQDGGLTSPAVPRQKGPPTLSAGVTSRPDTPPVLVEP